MDSMNAIYQEFDLVALKLLPDDWISQVNNIIDNKGTEIHLDGKATSSREPDGSQGCDYYVVSGGDIYKSLTWLHNLYKKDLLGLANQFSDVEMTTSKNIKAGVNINCVEGLGSRYEWHVDENPLTGLLFASTQTEEEGGALVFKPDGKPEKVVYPKIGLFLLFDARQITHGVMPLKTNTRRISIPMNFYFALENQDRDEALDTYLYGDDQ